MIPISEASIQSRYHKSTIIKYIHDKKVRGIIEPYKTLVSLEDLMNLRMTKKPRKTSYTNEQKDEVISIFLAGGDNRNKTIGEKVGLSEQVVNSILNKYYETRKPC